MCPKGADGMANSVDPDQTAAQGAVWSGSALFAQICLSESFGTLRYTLPILDVYIRGSRETKQLSCFVYHVYFITMQLEIRH